MPSKSKGGKGAKRGRNDTRYTDVKRELIYKEEEQEYAHVTKSLGDCRFECYCYDGVNRQAKIRGKDRSRMWVNNGDHILISKRNFQDQKCDILHKYNLEEVQRLKSLGEIPETTTIDNNSNYGFEFI